MRKINKSRGLFSAHFLILFLIKFGMSSDLLGMRKFGMSSDLLGMRNCKVSPNYGKPMEPGGRFPLYFGFLHL
jgi:hypothetical protein